MSILIAKYFHKKEERWLAYKKKGDAEIAAAMTLEGANRMAIEASRRRRSEHTSRRSMSARRMSERQSSETRKKTPGTATSMGVLMLKKLYKGGLTLEATASGIAKMGNSAKE